jgi:hypothetical protein
MTAPSGTSAIYFLSRKGRNEKGARASRKLPTLGKTTSMKKRDNCVVLY